jgi:hypothetical protein
MLSGSVAYCTRAHTGIHHRSFFWLCVDPRLIAHQARARWSCRHRGDRHHHSVDWSAESIDERVAIVRDGVGNRDVVLDTLVHHVQITNDAAGVAERVARAVPGLTPADVLAAPYALIGTVDEVIEELARHRARWGFTSYVIRADAMEVVAPLLDRLRGWSGRVGLAVITYSSDLIDKRVPTRAVQPVLAAAPVVGGARVVFAAAA